MSDATRTPGELRKLQALDALLSARTVPELHRAYITCRREHIEGFTLEMELMAGITAITPVTIDEFVAGMLVAFEGNTTEEADRDAA